jgi:hypothetical protein
MAVVGRAGKAEDLEKLLQEIDEAVDDFREKPDRCVDIPTFKEALLSGVVDLADLSHLFPLLNPEDKKEKEEHFEQMPDEQKADIDHMLELALAMCENPTRQTVEAWLRWMHDLKMRTCEILDIHEERTFTSSDFGTTWISNSGPQGECGTIISSRFYKINNMWVLSGRRVISNKEAKSVLCSEEEFFFEGKESKKLLECDYFKFGP